MSELQSELEELIDHYDHLAGMFDPASSDTFNARCETYAIVRDELEDLINDD